MFSDACTSEYCGRGYQLRCIVSQIFEAFEYVVAIFDEDHDGDLDCVTAERLELDMDVPSTTYFWMFKGHNGHDR